jgi:hypothetical protein
MNQPFQEGEVPTSMVLSEFDRRDNQILRTEAGALILYNPVFPADPSAP